MDQQAANLLAALRRTSASAESKLTLLNTLKSDIKHYRVPENAQGTIFECLKLAISQQTSSNIVTAALSTLAHLVKRLKIQDADGTSIASHAPRLWSALQERLGDARESNRTGASQALSDLWPYCTQDVERIIREESITLGNVRAKEMGMQWVVKMNLEASLQFKSFVPALVACLEDADGVVRDAAKSAVIELFRAAPDRAKADLKKQLDLHDVRKSIASQVLAQIGFHAHAPAPAHEVDLSASTRSLPALDHTSHFAESVNSKDAKPPPQEEVPMDPIFVYSHRELEDMFRDMAPHFEGRESEENWLLRDKDTTKLRRLTKGNAPSEYHTAYMVGIKQLQEGTLKAANTLRTTMSTNGCQLVQELARTLGPAMDPMVEIYLQSFIKMSAATKNIAAQQGQQTVDTIFQYVSYNNRLMHHIWAAAQDKNKQPRMFAAGWLRTLISRQAGSKTHFETSGGLAEAERIIKKCLDDADPKVKENMRATYWTYAKIWPEKAEAMMSTLDTKAKSALEKDSHNPNASKSSSQTNFAASTNSRASGARSALRDRIAAARNAKSNQPARPVTAMATMSPAPSHSKSNLTSRSQTTAPAPAASRTVSNASTASNATNKSVEANVSSSSSAATRPNSLMSGAARRPVKRPEITRPQTADPYATRRLRPETPSNQSPVHSPRQSTVGKSTAAGTTTAKNRTGSTASPAASPLRNSASSKPRLDSRQSSKDSHAIAEESSLGPSDDFTMVLPSTTRQDALQNSTRRRPVIDKTMSVDSGVSAVSGDGDLTMVMPSLHGVNGTQRERSPLAYRSPLRSTSEEASGIPLPSSARSSLRARSPPARNRSSADTRSPSAQKARVTPERSDTPIAEAQPNGVSRQSSPLKTSSAPAVQQEDIQIFEDPFTVEPPVSDAPNGHKDEAPRVLNELPINESNQRAESPAPVQSPTASNSSDSPQNGDNVHADGAMSPPQSPQTKAETLRSRKLLQSGIERIKARTLDTHGFRKVLDLTRSTEPLDLFGSHAVESKRYDDLMNALCDYVTAPLESASTNPKQSGQSNELKRQALGLLRSLLGSQQSVYKKWNTSGSWPTRCLTASFEARKNVEGVGMVVKDIESLVSEAVRGGRKPEILDTTIDFLEKVNSYNKEEEEKSTSTSEEGAAEDKNNAWLRIPNPATKSRAQATAFALRTLSASMTTDSTSQLTDVQRNRIVVITATHLRSRDAEVRKADVELATLLYTVWPCSSRSQQKQLQDTDGTGDEDKGDGVGKSEFWSALEKTEEGLQESSRNLIVYFIARREGRVEVK